MFPVSVKSENNICSCCLSCDRNLEPLDKYSSIFTNIMQGKISTIQNLNLSTMHACWECVGLLKRVLKFQLRAESAQAILQFSDIQPMFYPPLTTLNSITITEKSHQYYNHENLSLEIKYDIKVDLSDEIKPDVDVKNQIKDDDDDCVQSFDDGDCNDDFFESSAKRKYKPSNKDRKATAANKFKKIILKKDSINHKRVSVTPEQLAALMEKEKTDKHYLKNKYKCQSCIISYKTALKLSEHNEKYHCESSGPMRCKICTRRFQTSRLLNAHSESHYTKYACQICDETFYRRYNYYKHNMKYHTQIYECKECGKRFWRRTDFYEHFKEMHKSFICDYCGKSVNEKQTLINHMRRRHLCTKTCDVCKKTFSTVRNLRAHYRMYHTKSEAYCVECDLTLPNIELYKRHLRSSVKHRPKKKQSFPCPECGKVYARRCSMNYHYTYVHKQETKFKCEQCDRFFLNGFRLRTHKKATHDKIPPEKTKMCTICGRSFSTNRILENHIRTHTGERPHSCPHCPAAFAQRTAMRVHIRNIHLRTQS